MDGVNPAAWTNLSRWGWEPGRVSRTWGAVANACYYYLCWQQFRRWYGLGSRQVSRRGGLAGGQQTRRSSHVTARSASLMGSPCRGRGSDEYGSTGARATGGTDSVRGRRPTILECGAWASSPRTSRLSSNPDLLLPCWPATRRGSRGLRNNEPDGRSPVRVPSGTHVPFTNGQGGDEHPAALRLGRRRHGPGGEGSYRGTHRDQHGMDRGGGPTQSSSTRCRQRRGTSTAAAG